MTQADGAATLGALLVTTAEGTRVWQIADWLVKLHLRESLLVIVD